MYLYLSAILFINSLHQVRSQTCSPASDFLLYEISPLPTSSPYSSTTTLGPSCFVSSTQPGTYECFKTDPLPVLIDGNLGGIPNPPNLSAIHAWNRSQGDVRVVFRYSSAITVRHIRLYFYHVPSMGIGLPDVALFAAGTSQEYHVTGNQELNQTDARRRMIVLSLTNTLISQNTYGIVFIFGTSSKVDLLLLSEVGLCTEPSEVLAPSGAPELVPSSSLILSPNDVSPNLILSCTVRGEGRFIWTWSSPQSLVRVWSSDFTRTSTAEFTGVRGLSEGDTRYRCSAFYNPTINSIAVNSVAMNFDITFQFTLVAKVVNNIEVSNGSRVSLSCEVYGYLQRSIMDITWRVNHGIILTNNTAFTIISTEGTKLIQNGGAFPIPSSISQLTFVWNASTQNQVYTCEFHGRLQAFIVSTIEDTEEIIPIFPNKSSSTLLIVIIVIITAIVIAAIVTAIVIVSSIKYKRGKVSSVSDPVYEMPSVTNTDVFEMKKSEAYGFVTSAQEPYAMSACSAYEL